MSDLLKELVGYLAFLLLALSLIATNNLRFRWLNTGGCFVFTVYGGMIGAFPVILTNGILFFINVAALVRIYRRQEDFELVEFKPNAPLVAKFLRFYEADFKTYFPDFRLAENDNAVCFIVLRNMELANVFVATVAEDGTAFVTCNYTIAKFRDYKVGRFIFEKESGYLLSKGIRKLVYAKVPNAGHREFLHHMGFRREMVDGQEGMVKIL